MSKLTEVVEAYTVVKTEKDKRWPGMKYRAKCELFAEMRAMWSLAEDHEDYIRDHLKKTIVRYLEDVAYGELHEHLFKLERLVRDSSAYNSFIGDTFAEIYSIIRS